MAQPPKALVTGASRGLGRALAQRLLDQGHAVIAVARDEGRLADLAAAHPGRVIALPADLAEPAERDRLADRIAAEHPDLALVINNAARQEEIDLFADPAAATGRMQAELALNLAAPIVLTTALLPVLARQPAAHVVNVTSGLAFSPKAAAPGYSASKAGLKSFTTALRYQCEAAAPHIRVSEAILPLVDTDMTAGRGRGKIAPEAAAQAILDGALAGKSTIWVGKARLLPALARLSPALVARLLR